MTMFNLALKNVKRNMKSYGLYIGATVFSIILYFTFATLKNSGNIAGLAETSKQLQGIMSASSFVLIVFVAIFILYSNTFFMRKRKQEIGLYSLLGVRKKTIGFMLFFENMVIGLISLIIGIGLGFLLSQVFLIILLKLMGLTIEIGFAFSFAAIFDTLIVFFLIFLVTSILGYRVIYQFKLIDLFHAAKKGEEIPRTRIISVLLGIAALVIAYLFATEDLMDSAVWSTLGLATPLVVIGLTIIGSYLLFNNVLVFLLNTLKNRKIWAWKGLNLLASSQLLYRIRANAKTLTVITTLSATTITAGGAVFGLYYNVDKTIEQYSPYTFMWEGDAVEVASKDILAEVSFQVKELIEASEPYDLYYSIIDETTYHNLSEGLGEANIAQIANEEQGILIVDQLDNERWLGETTEVELQSEVFQVEKTLKNSITNIQMLPGSLYVVSDERYQQLTAEETNYHAVLVDNYKWQQALSDEIVAQLGKGNVSSAVEDYHEQLQASGVQLFVGSFLGLVFLFATGSIIFFKMMTEAEEDKDKYNVLHKIGVDDKEIKRTIRIQMGVIFIAPLALGLLHGTFALIAFSNLLMMNLILPVLIWMAAYTIVYIIYYFITVRSFYKTVTKEFYV